MPFMGFTGRCQSADQGVLTDLGLVLGQRETVLYSGPWRSRLARNRNRFSLGVRVDGEPAGIAFRLELPRRAILIVVRTPHGYRSPAPASTAAYPSRKVG